MVPGVQTVAYIPNEADSPSQIIGISPSVGQPTYRVTMRTKNPVTEGDFLSAWQAIDKVQTAAAAATRATLDVMKIRLSEAPDATLLNNAIAAETAAEGKYTAALETASGLTQRPGIVIARFTVGEAAELKGSAGDFLRAQLSKTESQSGYLVLGGVRTSTLIYGWDYPVFLKSLDDNQFDLFQKAGLTSYLLEANYVAFSSSKEIESVISASLSFKLSDLSNTATFLASIDQVKLSSYLAGVSRLASNGMIGPIEWENQEMPMVKWEGKKIDDTDLVAELNRRAEEDGYKLTKSIAKQYEWFPISILKEGNEPILYSNSDKEDGKNKNHYQIVHAVTVGAPRLNRKLRSNTSGAAMAVVRIDGRAYARRDKALFP